MLLTASLEENLNIAVIILLAGLIIVFAALIVLTLIIKGYSSLVVAAGGKGKKQKPTKAVVPKKAVPVKLPTNSLSPEVVAAITAAVYSTYGSQNVKINNIRRITPHSRSVRRHSAWASAGLADSTRPF